MKNEKVQRMKAKELPKENSPKSSQYRKPNTDSGLDTDTVIRDTKCKYGQIKTNNNNLSDLLIT